MPGDEQVGLLVEAHDRALAVGLLDLAEGPGQRLVLLLVGELDLNRHANPSFLPHEAGGGSPSVSVRRRRVVPVPMRGPCLGAQVPGAPGGWASGAASVASPTARLYQAPNRLSMFGG